MHRPSLLPRRVTKELRPEKILEPVKIHSSNKKKYTITHAGNDKVTHAGHNYDIILTKKFRKILEYGHVNYCVNTEFLYPFLEYLEEVLDTLYKYF